MMLHMIDFPYFWREKDSKFVSRGLILEYFHELVKLANKNKGIFWRVQYPRFIVKQVEKDGCFRKSAKILDDRDELYYIYDMQVFNVREDNYDLGEDTYPVIKIKVHIEGLQIISSTNSMEISEDIVIVVPKTAMLYSDIHRSFIWYFGPMGEDSISFKTGKCQVLTEEEAKLTEPFEDFCSKENVEKRVDEQYDTETGSMLNMLYSLVNSNSGMTIDILFRQKSPELMEYAKELLNSTERKNHAMKAFHSKKSLDGKCDCYECESARKILDIISVIEGEASSVNRTE